LGEWKFGSGKGFGDLICITLGTGVGGGIILDNKLYRGLGFAAGELGHVPINEKGPRCSCGGSGCLERYVGNSILVNKAKKIFRKKISLEEIDRLASKGNKKAKKFWEDTAEHIGNGLVGVVNLFNPELIIIGGGVSKAHRHLFKKIREVIKNRAMKVQGSMAKVVKARLGDDAGIIGTWVLVNNEKSL